MSETIARIQELLAEADELCKRGTDGNQQLLEIFAEISMLKARYHRETALRHGPQPAHGWHTGNSAPKPFATH
jgi:hypothetical protein